MRAIDEAKQHAEKLQQEHRAEREKLKELHLKEIQMLEENHTQKESSFWEEKQKLHKYIISLESQLRGKWKMFITSMKVTNNRGWIGKNLQ